MFKLALLGFTAFVGLASIACQTYSTGLQKSMSRADETVAINALHSIAVAEQTYSVSNGRYGTLKELRDADYLDSHFDAPNGGVKDYVLTLTPTPASGGAPAAFTCNADPTNSGSLAGRHFFIDSTSTAIHFNPDAPATAADPTY